MKTVLLVLALAVQSDERNIQLLDHLNPTVRANAAEILGIMKVRAAIPALINRVDDPVLRVRSAAADALKKITERDFGTDYAQWQLWWDTEGKKKFREQITSKEEVNAAVKEGLRKLEEEVDDAKWEIRFLSITVAAVSFVFVLVMIFFVGNVSSKLKEWKEVAKQTDVYLREGQEITKRTDKIMEELEGKKVDIIGFVNKLREENQAELDRYCDLLQQNIDHRMREEVMAHETQPRARVVFDPAAGRKVRKPTVLLVPKDLIKAKIGRSPDRADAFVLAVNGSGARRGVMIGRA